LQKGRLGLDPEHHFDEIKDVENRISNSGRVPAGRVDGGEHMKNFDSRVYSVSDFLEWYNNDQLELNPDFQRRAVWSEKAKSYLIDTIIRGKPMPKIFISQSLKKARNIRVVVDGQQRLRAIIGYVNGDYRISRAHNPELYRYSYSDLPETIKSEFLQYELSVDILFDMPYEDILDIFARINSYTVTLNTQEKLNAFYLGYFKQTAFQLGHRYATYFVEGGIMTKAKVTRMAEAELASDLLVALTDGIQTNKNIEQYYKKYEDELGSLTAEARKFETIMSYIGAIYKPEELLETNWSRIHLFYTLFTSLGHLLFDLKGPQKKPHKKVSRNAIGKLRVRLDEISARYDEVADNMEDKSFPADYKRFITWSRRGTTDTSTRISRTDFVCDKLIEVI
jgi:hypothetical protein